MSRSGITYLALALCTFQGLETKYVKQLCFGCDCSSVYVVIILRLLMQIYIIYIYIVMEVANKPELPPLPRLGTSAADMPDVTKLQL